MWMVLGIEWPFGRMEPDPDLSRTRAALLRRLVAPYRDIVSLRLADAPCRCAVPIALNEAFPPAPAYDHAPAGT